MPCYFATLNMLEPLSDSSHDSVLWNPMLVPKNVPT